MANNVIVVE